MNRKMMILGIAVVAVLVVVLAPVVSTVQAQGAGIVASANGAGQITSGGEWRTFSFTAQKDSSNISSGQAELFSRASNLRVHMDIDCLKVVGNTATMSGTVTLVSDNVSGITVGLPIWFRVVDNGSGADSPPDLISRVGFFSGPPGVPCTDGTVLPANIPIEAGNITVH
jgi:hypothetical protein